MGGKEKNKHGRKKLRAGHGAVGKVAIGRARDHATNHAGAALVERTDTRSLQRFVADRAGPDAKVYTDDHGIYRGMPFNHEAVKHSASEYVRDQAHTNGIESFWAALEGGYHGTYRHMSEKHLQRYVNKFSDHHNLRDRDTIGQMSCIPRGIVGKRLTYRELVSE